MDRLWQYWNSLPPPDQTAVKIGVAVTVGGGIILAVMGALGKLSLAGLKRLSGKSSPVQPLPPPPQPITIKFEPSQLISPVQSSQAALAEEKTPAAFPEIPRTSAVEFVARRDREGRDILVLLKEKLGPQNDQLIVLWGPGGVGKTRLASEAAHALKEAFANRIVWVSADGRPDFGLATLLDGIASQLDRVELHQLAPDPKKAQVRELMASEPPLVILDNFETIGSEEQKRCSTFLAEEASCPALVTTRGMIASHFAYNVPIDAMSQDEADLFLNELIAQAPDPAPFAETNRQRIIQVSAANPLVMQWVVQQIVLTQEPQAVLEKLSQGEGDAAERVFDNSFELPYVGDDGRAALLALSLFPSGATRPSLTEVAGFGNDAARLDLAAKSLGALRLIKTTESGKRLLVEGLTRELAKARLSKDDPTHEFAKRFVIYFQTYAEAHAKTTPEDFAALETERENVLNAIDVASALGDWASVMRTRSALEQFLCLHGYWEDAIRTGKQALSAARELTSTSSTARFAHQLGESHQRRGEPDEARRLYHESRQIHERLGDQGGIAINLHGLAWLAQSQGELEEAQRLFNESLEIKKRAGNQHGIASTLHHLALLAQDQGGYDEAQRLFNESLEINNRLGDQAAIASTTSQLGIVHLLLGETAKSKAKHEESLAIRRKLGDQQGIAVDLHQLGRLAQDQGELDEARQLYNESMEIEKKLGDQRGIAKSLHQLASVCYAHGELDEARLLFSESLGIKKRLGDRAGIAVTLGALGTLAEVEGNNAEAAQLFGEALEIFEKLRSPNAEIARRSLDRVKGNRSEGI